jgi:Ca2+-binding RTX toxin-like protein
MTIAARRLHRIAVPVLAVLAAALALPASAAASTVSSDGTTVTVQAGAGERNDVAIAVVGSEVVLTDRAGATASLGCTQSSASEVRCPSATVTDLVVETGDLDDAIVNGTSLRASLDGGTGDDRFVSGARRDRISGGDGVDLVDYSARTARLVIHTGGGGDDDGEANERDEILGDVESFTGGSGDDDISADSSSTLGGTLLGGPGDDRLFGSEGDDTFDGGPGGDLMLGGTIAAPDRDTVLYTDRTRAVAASIASGVGDDGETGEGDTIWEGMEVIRGGSGDDTLRGFDEDEELYGNGGDDVLAGGRGDDVIDGGPEGDGGDWVDYSYEPSSALALDLALERGGFPVNSEVDDVVEIENAIGSPSADTIRGDGGPNVLRGGAGGDTLDGAGAEDTADYRDHGASDPVTVTIGSGVGDDGEDGGFDGLGDTVPATTEHVIGGDGDDDLRGDGGANRLTGGRGADRLDGGGGVDVADYTDHPADDAVTLDLDGASGDDGDVGGFDGAGDTLATTIEDLVGTDGDDTLVGGSGPNELLGRGGADVLRGGDGDDELGGGAGDDRFDEGAAANGADTIAGGDGVDLVDYAARTAAVSLTLGGLVGGGGAGEGDLVSVEDARGGTAADALTGDGDDNALDGGDGGDALAGGAGEDTLDGAAGADTLRGQDDDDTLTGGAGDDTLAGGGEDDTLTGGDGTDAFDGGDGDDTLAARDGLGETVACGAGADSAVTDWQDTASGCESNDATANPDRDGDGLGNDADCAPDDARRPAQGGADADCDGVVDVVPPSPPAPSPPTPGPSADVTPPVVALRGVAAVARDGTVSFKLTCDEACSGSVSLASARSVRATRRARAVVLRFGSAGFLLSRGGTATVRLKISRTQLALLKRHGRLAVKAIASVRDVAGNVAPPIVVAFTLQAPRARARSRARRR